MAQATNGAQDGNALIWIDLEMTGLNPETDRIIEIATIVTDSELNIVAEGPVLAVHQSDAMLAGMDDWNQRTHSGTGLIERVKQSPYSEAEAERITLEFLQKHVPKNKSPMYGNSNCQDRRFLARTMSQLETWFHYRNLDVSSIKGPAIVRMLAAAAQRYGIIVRDKAGSVALYGQDPKSLPRNPWPAAQRVPGSSTALTRKSSHRARWRR